jgi:hypothetical protein
MRGRSGTAWSRIVWSAIVRAFGLLVRKYPRVLFHLLYAGSIQAFRQGGVEARTAVRNWIGEGGGDRKLSKKAARKLHKQLKIAANHERFARIPELNTSSRQPPFRASASETLH